MKNKKAQSLPLNTIVIAILVIIVLLVVIVFFTSKLNDTSNSLDHTTDGFKNCEVGNFAISADKYSSTEKIDKNTLNGCKSVNGVRIYGVEENNLICCAIPK